MRDIWILGINGLGNSPSACLLKNGNMVAMAEEERFTRIKGSHGVLPIKSIKYCIAEGGITLDKIKEIAFAWDCNFYLWGMPVFLLKQFFKNILKPKSSPSNIQRAIQELIKYNPFRVKRLIKLQLLKEFNITSIPKIYFVNHHLSHAASAHYGSGFDSSYVLVIDGSGENTATSIWKAEERKLILKKKWLIPNSIGWFYSMITEFLGFIPNRHEGKTMALAAYGEKDMKLKEKFNSILSPNPSGYLFDSDCSITGEREMNSFVSKKLLKLLGKGRDFKSQVNNMHKNIAYAAQKTLEETVSHLIGQISGKHDFKGNLSVAGGVALNCKLNGLIAEYPTIQELYIPPFPSDIGTSFGAAVICHNRHSKAKPACIKHAYWGPEFSEKEILNALENSALTYKKIKDIEKMAAQLLFENKIIGWFQGRMETGARALGNRSILANPSYKKNRDFINLEIKNREEWRPFAASVLYEKREFFFDKKIESPFMGIALRVKANVTGKIPAAIHIDHTTRPQLVKKEVNERYWELINHFGQLSGIYAVLNTSFNLKEEPIVCTPKDALEAFENSPIDFLIIEDFLISRP